MPKIRSFTLLATVLALTTLAAIALARSDGASAGVAVPAQLDLGLRFSCARMAAGDALCWGENHVGQLGDGTTTDRAKPAPVLGLSGAVTEIAVGGLHACTLMEDTGAQCWGWNRYGQLGNGTTTGPFVANPTPSDVLTGLGGARLTDIDAIEAGGVHTCAIMASGGLECWGWNRYGQIGDGQGCGTVCAPPTNVTGLASGVAAVALGDSHSCAVLDTGAVKCWGLNERGQLGAESSEMCGTSPLDLPCSTAPLDVPGLSNVIDIAAGNNHTCARTDTGDVQCWGDNSSGQLGAATTETCGEPPDDAPCSTTPLAVTGLPSGVLAIAAGGNHTCALVPEVFAAVSTYSGVASGGAQCWGDNGSGQLGDGQACGATCTTPVSVSGLTAGVDAVGGGGDHTCAFAGSSSLFCWGANDNGQVGDGSRSDRNVPVGVLGFGSAPDSDSDGCTDEQELGADETLGGRRNPNHFWDFFDTPDANNGRDRAVTIGDVFRIIARFGTNGIPGDPLTQPPASGYHSAFDRSPAAPGGDPWDLRGPDGIIGTNDILFAVLQFGHACSQVQ